MISLKKIASAVGKFSICEYGKLGKREMQRIQDSISEGGERLDAAELEAAAWSSVNDKWSEVLADLSPHQKMMCFSAAESIAKGSGRREIPGELYQRMTLLFGQDGVPEDIEKTYQEVLREREDAELADIAQNGPLFMRFPEWRVSTTGEPLGFECSAVPAYPGRKRTITVYRFDTKTEFPISVKSIKDAVDLRTGEICDAEGFSRKI